MASVQGAGNPNTAIQQWQRLQALLTAGSANASQKTGSGQAPKAFDPLAGLGEDPTQSAGASGSLPSQPLSPGTMGALLDAQAQASGTSASSNGLSQYQQTIFGKLDNDSDGKVTKSELNSAFGADNKAASDYVMKKLDTDGDGAISKAEFGEGTRRTAGHHRKHAPQPSDALQTLMAAAKGANALSAANADGTTTTTVTYADGSKVSMTSAPATNTDSSANGNGSQAQAKSNLLEQLIQLQAQLTSSITPTSGTSA